MDYVELINRLKNKVILNDFNLIRAYYDDKYEESYITCIFTFGQNNVKIIWDLYKNHCTKSLINDIRVNNSDLGDIILPFIIEKARINNKGKLEKAVQEMLDY